MYGCTYYIVEFEVSVHDRTSVFMRQIRLHVLHDLVELFMCPTNKLASFVVLYGSLLCLYSRECTALSGIEVRLLAVAF
jgi:hypothetical protein